MSQKQQQFDSNKVIISKDFATDEDIDLAKQWIEKQTKKYSRCPDSNIKFIDGTTIIKYYNNEFFEITVVHLAAVKYDKPEIIKCVWCHSKKVEERLPWIKTNSMDTISLDIINALLDKEYSCIYVMALSNCKLSKNFNIVARNFFGVLKIEKTEKITKRLFNKINDSKIHNDLDTFTMEQIAIYNHINWPIINNTPDTLEIRIRKQRKHKQSQTPTQLFRCPASLFESIKSDNSQIQTNN